MTMKFEDILITYYASAFAAGQFSMAYDDNGAVYISSWNVPNVTEPTVDEVMALDTPQLELQFTANQFFVSFLPVLEQFIDSVAMQKNYTNALSCISYLDSSITEWAAQAKAFLAWRDSVWVYVGQQEQEILAGTMAIPADSPTLLSELPVIVWP